LGSVSKINQKGTLGGAKSLESNPETVVKEQKTTGKYFGSFYCTANFSKTINFRD
jgi:hypothetical protein